MFTLTDKENYLQYSLLFFGILTGLSHLKPIADIVATKTDDARQPQEL